MINVGVAEEDALRGHAVATRTTSAGGPVEIGAEPVDFHGLYAALRRRIWLIATAATIATLATWIHLRLAPREYRAGAVIRLVDTRRAIAGNFDNPVARPLGGAQIDPIQSEIEVLLSRSIAAKVVDRQPLGLQMVPVDLPVPMVDDVKLKGNVDRDTVILKFDTHTVTATSSYGRQQVPYGTPVELGPLHFTVTAPLGVLSAKLVIRPRSVAIDTLRNNLFAKARELTDVVDVSYTAPDPISAKMIVDAVVQVFQANNVASARDQSQRRRVFIAGQLRQTDSLLLAAQDRLSAYRSRNQVNSTSDVVAARVTALLNQDVRRQDLGAEREVFQTLLDSLTTSAGRGRQRTLRALVSSPGVADNPVVQDLFSQLFLYESMRDSLTTGRWSSAPTNPDVLRLDSLIAATQSNLSDAVGSQIVSLDAQAAAIDDVRLQSTEALKRLPPVMAGEARLRQQVKSAEDLAGELRDEYQAARIAEAVEAGDVEIIDLATVPGIPIGPRRRLQLLAGMLVGLVLGIAIALMRERANTAMWRGSDVEGVLGIPKLAVIPFISPASGEKQHFRIGRISVALPFSGRIRRRYKSGKRATLITVSDSKSNGAEAFRLLRTNLMFSQSIRPLRTIVVTSPSPKDGKTTTAANLAVTFAQLGMRVLLIDCDLRRARVHGAFGLPREPGLTELVLGHADVGDVVRPTLVDQLDVVTAGVRPPNPSELLGGAPMRTLLEQFARSYDFVVLDTSPVHVAADAAILGRLSDGVVLVLRAGKTERATALDTVNRLLRGGVYLLGAVLNDPEHQVVDYADNYSGAYDDVLPHSATAT